MLVEDPHDLGLLAWTRAESDNGREPCDHFDVLYGGALCDPENHMYVCKNFHEEKTELDHARGISDAMVLGKSDDPGYIVDHVMEVDVVEFVDRPALPPYRVIWDFGCQGLVGCCLNS